MVYTITLPTVTSNVTVVASGGGGGGSAHSIVGTGGGSSSISNITLSSTSTSGQILTTTGWGSATFGLSQKPPSITIAIDGDIYQGSGTDLTRAGVFARLERIEAALGLLCRNSKYEAKSPELAAAGDSLSKVEDKLLNTACMLEQKFPELKTANDLYRELFMSVKMEEYLTKDEDV